MLYVFNKCPANPDKCSCNISPLKSQNFLFNILVPSFFFLSFSPPGAQYLPVVLTWLWLWVITLWHWITQINSFSNQSCQGLLSKSDVAVSSFSALLFAGEFWVEASNVCSCLPILYLMQRIAWRAPVLAEALTKCSLTRRNVSPLVCVWIPCNSESIAALVAIR